jgi:hypothetical protein
VLIVQTPSLDRVCREEFDALSTTSSSPVVYLTQGFKTASELDFIQLRRIAQRFSEALQQFAWNLNHVGLLLGCGKMDLALPMLNFSMYLCPFPSMHHESSSYSRS